MSDHVPPTTAYFSTLIPADLWNDVLGRFSIHQIDDAQETLMQILDLEAAHVVLKNLDDKQKREFVLQCQENYQSPELLQWLIDIKPSVKNTLQEKIERQLLALTSQLSEQP